MVATASLSVSLPPCLSITVVPSDRAAFDGGGTRFDCLAAAASATTPVVGGADDGVLHCSRGEIVTFEADLFHAGVPISRGAPPPPPRRRGWRLLAVRGPLRHPHPCSARYAARCCRFDRAGVRYLLVGFSHTSEHARAAAGSLRLGDLRMVTVEQPPPAAPPPCPLRPRPLPPPPPPVALAWPRALRCSARVLEVGSSVACGIRIASLNNYE